MTALIIAVIIGLFLSIAAHVIWNKKYGKRYIDISVLPLRKKYRNIYAFGLMLLMVAIMSIGEFYGFADGYLWLLLPAMLMSNMRIFFEPYYTTDIIDRLDDFCLYLRPFVSDKQRNWGLMNEPLEKALCGIFNKRIAKCFCIGDPNTAMPTTLSTSGIYASDSEWQDAVKKMSEKCKVILLRVMETEGCIWEMKNCINRHLDKTIFLINESRDFELLKEFITDKDIEIPNVTISNKGFIALYYDGKSWSISLLRNNSDIKQFINNYIEFHKGLEEEIKHNNSLGNIIKAPFRSMEIKQKWVHYVAFLMQPFWYIIYNRWPRFWTITSITYAFTAIAVSLFLEIMYDTEGIYLLIFLIFSFVYMWFAPRITTAFNKNGSKYITQKVNTTLLKWIGVYYVLLYLTGMCIPSNIENQEYDFTEAIMTEQGYRNYTAIETRIDSSFSSIYTDEQIRICALECHYLFNENENGNNNAEIISVLNKFYNTVQNFKSNEFIGWEITHTFSHYNTNGEYVESQCMIITDKNFDRYFIYSLDENEMHLNYFEIKGIIDVLMSDEFIENYIAYLEEIEEAYACLQQEE